MTIDNFKFENQITPNQSMPIKDAVAALMRHHNVPEGNILKAFSNFDKHLKTEGATVTFVLQPAQDSFTARIFDGKGTQVDNEIVDRWTGQPINHVH